MILTVCLNPTLQNTLVFGSFEKGRVNRALSHRQDASGKGVNVSRVLRQLGAPVMHLTQLGGRSREWFASMLAADGIPVTWVESGSEIRSCYTLLEGSGPSFCMTEAVEEGDTVGPDSETGIKREYETFVESMCSGEKEGGGAAVVISGTKAAGFSASVFPDMIRYASERHILTVADFRGADLLNSLPYRPSVIKPNLEEFIQTFFAFDRDPGPEAVRDKMRSLYETWGCRVVVTRGHEPLWAFDGDGFHTVSVVPAENPVNTIGCGDAFTAGFAAALVSGAGFSAALEEGVRCGALNAAHLRPGDITG